MTSEDQERKAIAEIINRAFWDHPGSWVERATEAILARSQAVAAYSEQPVADDERLPIEVTVGRGLKFGRGVPLRLLLDALKRRAEFEAGRGPLGHLKDNPPDFSDIIPAATGARPVEGWRPITPTSMPPVDEWSVVWIVGASGEGPGIHMGDKDEEVPPLFDTSVTHWMPLPPAPLYTKEPPHER